MIVSKNLEHKKVPIIPSYRSISEIGVGVFTPEENYNILRACYGAARFMEDYGKAPEQPMIDKSHYFEGITINDKKQWKINTK